jgi:hypothetical protein
MIQTGLKATYSVVKPVKLLKAPTGKLVKLLYERDLYEREINHGWLDCRRKEPCTAETQCTDTIKKKQH